MVLRLHCYPLRCRFASPGWRAFTLFEMCVVVLIIGIAAAAIVPAVDSNITSPRLRTAANMLASDIEFCASECIAQPSSPRSITFDTTHNTYTVIDSNAGTAINHPMDSQPYINDFLTGRNTQLTGVTLTSLTTGGGTLTSLSFDAYGHPQISADLVITLTYKGQSMTVTVKNVTGDVSISG